MDWSFYNDIFKCDSGFKKMRKIISLLPLILLITVCLFFLLFILLNKDPKNPPSALLNKDLPIFSLVNLYKDNEYLFSKNSTPGTGR